MNRFFVTFYLLPCFWVLCGCDALSSGKEQVLGTLAAAVPPEMLETLDRQSWNSLRPQLKLFENAQAKMALEQLARPIVDGAQKLNSSGKTGLQSTSWKFNIVVSPELNAFALPGGTIAVNTGLILYSESGLELVGVLGHEVAHVTLRHGVKSLVATSGVSVALSYLLGDFGPLSGFLLQQGATLGLLGFSRSQESQADETGALILTQAGYPSLGLAQFFTTLQEQAEKEVANKSELEKKYLSLLSTHPMSEERAVNLRTKIELNSQQALDATSLQHFRVLRNLVLEGLSAEEKKQHLQKFAIPKESSVK